MKETKKSVLKTIRISELIGKTVFTEEEGKLIGKIIKVAFNHRTKKMSSIVVQSSFWNRELFQIMADEFITFGEDLVNITTIKKCFLMEEPNLIKDITFQNIEGHRVITNEGKLLGTIEDIIISRTTFKIYGLVFKDFSFLKINPNQVVLGLDEIIVPSSYENKVTQDNRESFINRLIHFKSHEEIKENEKNALSNKHKQSKIQKELEEELDF